MTLVRYVLPAALAIAGILFLTIRMDTLGIEMFAMLVGAALSVLLLNWLFRLGSKGDEERAAEAAARDYYSAHGRWPDED
jgi:ABC-type transport system involved in cytochrome bd biosynthesis fused ATPase/permease subunit